MMRKVNPNSTHFLKRQVRELAAVNEALAKKLAAFVADHEETVARLIHERDGISEQLKVSVEDASRFEGMWSREYDRSKQVLADAKRYEQERDGAKFIADRAREEREQIERERDEARMVADQLRLQLFPRGPQFPWEGPAMLKVHTGPKTPIHFGKA